MRCFRFLLSVAVVSWATGMGNFSLAQETDASAISLTLAPLQYAYVKGNVGNFQALNWMPVGSDAGVSDISFVKNINKDISLDVQGSEFPESDNGDAELTLKKGDVAFLRIDYKAFRKYYDNDGGIYPYEEPSDKVTPKSGPSYTYPPAYVPSAEQGAQLNSPDLQMDISYFKLEAGLGDINDPFLDVAYEHNSKDGDKSLLEWAPAYNHTYNIAGSPLAKNIGPSYESVDDTADTLTIKEKKDVAGVTIKGEQTLEVDYNSDTAYLQSLSPDTTGTVDNEMKTLTEHPDAKLFGAGIRFEKWMLNDNTYAGLGYHYNHIHDTDLMQTQVQEPELVSGVVSLVPISESGWNFSHASQDDHVWVGNLNTNLTHDLNFVADVRYEHMGSEGISDYYSTNTSAANIETTDMENHEDQEGEHVELRYSGIAHTTLYAASEMEQERNLADEFYTQTTTPSTSDFMLDRLDRTQNESWTAGARVVPDRFFTFSSQVKAHDNDNVYDTLAMSGGGDTSDILMNSLREKGVDETSTLTWKPYRWIQNSLKYQFSDTVYNPQLAPQVGTTTIPNPNSHGYILPPAGGEYNITENHMLTSQFTYDISVQPIDPLLLMFTYSHVENYVRTIGASSAGSTSELGPLYMPEFNSGDNSFLFSTSYAPLESLVWTSTMCYTISPNYVDFGTGLPLGSDFRQTSFSTGLEWTFHKWLRFGPGYEYASYKVDPIAGTGNYSANIIKFNVRFNW